MINKYKDAIIDKALQYIEWEKSEEIRSTYFVCMNTKKVLDLSEEEFLLYRTYVRCALPIFIYHENYEDDEDEGENEDDGGWREIRDLFFNILDCERQEFVEKYWNAQERLDKKLKFLSFFCLEFYKFITIYYQLFLRNCFLSRQLEEYSFEKMVEDYVKKINIRQKMWSMLNAWKNVHQPNPINYLDVSTLSNNDFASNRLLHYDVFRKMEEHTIPFTDNFVENLRATNRELVFQMVISMLDFVEDKTMDAKLRQLELFIWNYKTQYYYLFQTISINAVGFNLKGEGQKYNWKEVLNLLSIEELDSNFDNSDIISTKDEATSSTDFIRVPSSKYRGGNNLNRKDRTLYKCLEKLYHKLYDGTEFSCKEAFIYRFSGFNRPDNLQMECVVENAFLGKIVRCLYEDKTKGYTPPYKKMSKYFGLNANIAGAGNIKKGAKGTEEVIKLLSECGFVNVDVFEELKVKKVERIVS